MIAPFDPVDIGPTILKLHQCFNMQECQQIWQRILAANFNGYNLTLLTREYEKKILELGGTFYYRPRYPATYVYARLNQLVFVATATDPIGFFSRDSFGNVQLNAQPVGLDSHFELDSDNNIQPKLIV